MPQLVMEYTPRVMFPKSVSGFLGDLNVVFAECDSIELPKIKSRAFQLEEYCMGDYNMAGEFIYVLVRILPGRDAAAKLAMREKLLSYIRESVGVMNQNLHLHIAVEISELHDYSFMLQEGA